MTRGFTLIEVVLGLVLVGMLGTIAASVAGGAMHSARVAIASAASERTTATVTALVHEDFRDANPGDVASAQATTLTFARPVGEAVICGGSGPTVWLQRDGFVGSRAPEGDRDVARILVDAVTGRWADATISAVASDRCPGTTKAAWRLTLARALSGPIARITEPVRLLSYRSGGEQWLGLANPGSTAPVQPFAGPVVPATTRFVLTANGAALEVQPVGASSVARYARFSPP